MTAPIYLRTSTVIGTMLWSGIVFAQDVRQEPASGDIIIVTGAGLKDAPSTAAYDTEVLDRQDLIATGTGRIEDALSSVAGFQQFRRSDSRSTNPSAQGATLRALGGNATSRALVLLDGVPLSDPFFGYIPFSSIDPGRLSYARVTRGGGAGPFGSGALAGTIELQSAGPDDLNPASGRFLVSDQGDTEASIGLAPRLGDGFAVVSGRWDRGPGFFTTPTDQRVPATVRSRYDSCSLEGRGVAPISSDVEMQARMLVFDDQRTLRFEGADNSSSGADASLRFVGSGPWAFDILGYIQSRNFSNVVVSSTRFVPVLDQRNTPSTGLGGKIEVRPPVGGGHTLRLGTDYRRSSGALSEFAISAQSGNVTARRSAGGVNSDLGAFIEDDWRRGPLTLTAGLRGDLTRITNGFFRETNGTGETVEEDRRYTDRTEWTTSVRGGAVLQISPWLSVRSAAYSSFRVPTLNELYRPFTVFPVVTQANANLKNERLEGFEIGADVVSEGAARLSLTAFDNTVNDAVANVTIAENLRQRQNIDAIHARGLEFDGMIQFGRLEVAGSLALIDAKMDGAGDGLAPLSGNRPAQTPELAANLSATYEFANAGLVRLTARHVGSQFEDDQETDSLPAFTTLDAFARWPVGNSLAVTFRAENLTDVRRVVRNQGGSIDLGAPRTLWLGISFGR